MLFGDSITQGAWEPGVDGFGERLSHIYARKLDVINRGYSGYNTEWGLPVFAQCFPKRTDGGAKVKVLTIWFGANDACIKPSPQHVPLDKFISNLKTMIEMVQSSDSLYYSPSTRIILITPPPVGAIQRAADLAARDPPLPLDRLFETTRMYADGIRALALDKKVAVADVWTSLWEGVTQNEAALDEVLADGLHLNRKGYEIMYETLIKTISAVYPEVHYDNVPYIFPAWDKINWDSPEESLHIEKKI